MTLAPHAATTPHAATAPYDTATPARAAATETAGTPRPGRRAGSLGRLGAAALVVGAALNTGQAVLLHSLSSGDTSAAKLADVDAHPVAMLAMVLGGMLGVVLMLVGFQAVARMVRPCAPRAAAIGAGLTFVGCLGFFGMHALMLVTYALASYEDRATAVAVLDHLDASPLLLVVVVPFLLLFVGAAALTVALFRTPGVARWVPVCWAVFLVLDLAAKGVGPVDPHWLFLAGAVGIALTGRAAAKR